MNGILTNVYANHKRCIGKISSKQRLRNWRENIANGPRAAKGNATFISFPFDKKFTKNVLNINIYKNAKKKKIRLELQIPGKRP